jgi:hypothetical protein
VGGLGDIGWCIRDACGKAGALHGGQIDQIITHKASLFEGEAVSRHKLI